MNQAAPTLPHVPVMARECLEWLDAGPGRTVIDGTFGAGGHSRLLLEAGCTVIAIDQDPRAAETAAAFREEFGGRFSFHAGNFRDLDRVLPPAAADGALFDLGVSSMQLDEGERGFAFRQDGPLDMRMSKTSDSAADVIRDMEEADLAAVIYRLGEERHSRRIARAIKAAQAEEPITTTGRLAEVIVAAYPGGGKRRDHPARRTFQALRLHVNDELGALQAVLDGSATVLSPGGRLVVMSYHSLEDRIVKHTLLNDARWNVLTRRPVIADEAEVETNPRARSAKLRAAERTSP